MTDGARKEKVGETRVLEDVLDEVLSFNYRSLRTLRDIFLRPATVARAFLDGDRARYTPTMRVWFGVLTWMFLLSMVWGGWGEVIWRISGDGAAFGDALREGRRDIEAVRAAISTMAALLYVPIEALLFLPGVIALRSMRKGVNFLHATQCYFIPVTAGAVTSTLVLVASSVWPDILKWAFLINIVIFMAIAGQVIRVGFSSGILGMLGKTVLLTLVVTALSVLARMLTLLISIFWALTQVPPVG
ncbi:DUF3667 domain-containing protein [Maricaulis sp.]|uniref:DUF3667 domain-containing protein n=1 Tax=Maricaulis sp. TaxID=1486257 RepID=UPI002B2753E1|nr:DUF3667 domain-containing protein [Maricaulis sp.]